MPGTDDAGFAEPSSAGAQPPPDGELERLDRRVVPYWLISGVLSLLVLAVPVAGALVIFGGSLPVTIETAVVVVAVVFALLLGWQLVAPSLAYQRWRYRIDEQLLVARYGIIFHEEKVIPMSRLQHVDLTRGPVERMFGLATLVVHTAGSDAAAFRLPGLAVERADELRDRILEARGHDVI